jgi:RNA-dependent RNA polymerase
MRWVLRDMFSVICYDPLLPTTFEDAASYESCGTKKIDRDSTVEDICDFIVEYINSDVLVRGISRRGGSDQ